jgi:hypothetical protein
MVDMTTPVALYAIVRQNNGSSRIVWKKCWGILAWLLSL